MRTQQPADGQATSTGIGCSSALTGDLDGAVADRRDSRKLGFVELDRVLGICEIENPLDMRRRRNHDTEAPATPLN